MVTSCLDEERTESLLDSMPAGYDFYLTVNPREADLEELLSILSDSLNMDNIRIHEIEELLDSFSGDIYLGLNLTEDSHAGFLQFGIRDQHSPCFGNRANAINRDLPAAMSRTAGISGITRFAASVDMDNDIMMISAAIDFSEGNPIQKIFPSMH